MSKRTFVAFGVASAIAVATLTISPPVSAQMGRRWIRSRNDVWTRLWTRHDPGSRLMGPWNDGRLSNDGKYH